MIHKNQGLTVGELTIAIAALLLVGLIWSNIKKETNGEKISLNLQAVQAEFLISK